MNNQGKKSFSRRDFLVSGAMATATLTAGCVGLIRTGKSDDDKNTGANNLPVWTTIPNQTWTVGVPVSLDLAAYCTDADGDTLTFSLDQALPPGLTLNGSVISGTPTGVFASASYIAAADDGQA